MDKEKIAGIGGIIAGSIGSVCCVGPAILAGLGFGSSIVSFVRDLGGFHLPMIILAFLMLGVAFYFHYRGKSKVNVGEGCCKTDLGKTSQNRFFLWIATGLTTFFVLLPYLF